ncbi:MAG: hypothetical protein E7088_05180 [Bacteroidales bacterium]|nr:hypothetical protein [Bacteroidales bacterium]
MVKEWLNRLKGSNILTFLFFVLVSCCMWLLQTLNEKYETDISFALVVENAPEGVEFEEGDNHRLSIVLRDYGTVLMGYLFDDNMRVEADYSEFSEENGRLVLPVSAIKSRVMSAVEPSTTIIQFVDDEIVLNIKRDVEKRNVAVASDFALDNNCDLLSVEATPATVTVTALPGVLSSMDNISTVSLRGLTVSGDTVVRVALENREGVLVSPSSVDVKIAVSSVMSKVVRVPLELVNFPPMSTWTLVPVDVDISFDVAKADYDKVVPGDFKVILDYNDYVNAPDGGDVALILASSSPLASNVAITPSVIIKSKANQIIAFDGNMMW